MDVPLPLTGAPGPEPVFHLSAALDPSPSLEAFESVVAQKRRALHAAPSGPALAEKLTTLSAGRALLLAAKDRPVWTVFSCGEEGRTATGLDVLAALIVMEGMGCAAFGLDSSDPDALLEQYQRLLPYATVPLVWPRRPLPILSSPSGSALRDPDVIPCASGSEARFLTPDVDVGTALRCGPNLLEEILETEENRPQGALKIAILDEDDLFSFAEAQYAIRDALCIWSDVPELLERALRLYQGRAFWDGTEDLPDGFLDYLSRTYGLILL